MTAAIADATSPATTPAPLDEGAFSEEFVGLLPSMRAFARSLCRNRAEADDLAQTAMMNAWRARHSYTPGTNLRAWLYTILRNQYISERRRAAAWRSTISVEDTVLPVPQNQEAKVEMNDLQSALMKLPEEQREALILVGAGGFAYHEAAELCGCAVGTIKSRVARARRALTAIMGAGMMGKGAEAQGSPSEGKEPEGARIDDAKSETHTEA